MTLVDKGLTRREFLKGATMTALLLASEELLAAEAPPAAAPSGPPVGCGVVGVGAQGKELLAALSRLESAKVLAFCDSYEPFLNRAKEVAPAAAAYQDSRKLLDSKDVQAVFVATPSHLHKDIALAALQAGKHVYCEAPLATTIQDCKEIALAAKGAKQVFQVGQQFRANKLQRHVLKFVRTGVLGTCVQARAQWHKKESWKRIAPTPEREEELNWRLSKATSAGLPGEVGIHQFDVINWYLDALPVSIVGYGGILHWKDGRDVPDTVQCIFEYPSGVRAIFDATLASSAEGAYELFQGSDGAILLRDERSWLLKEADAPMLGWEVYARKEKVGDDSGICLIADSTKYIKAGKEPGKEAPTEPGKNALVNSVESFVLAVQQGGEPACSAEQGYRAAVTAIKANEAVLSGTKVTLPKELFDLQT